MHVPRPLFELRRFVFVLQYKFIKAFNSDMNEKRILQSISIALFCFLERFCGGDKYRNRSNFHSTNISQFHNLVSIHDLILANQ